MNSFERYLTLWVTLAIAIGIAMGHYFPAQFEAVADIELFQINLPVAVLVWAMIFPMMAAIDFSQLRRAKQYTKGIVLTSVINYGIKPFSMLLFGWLFLVLLFGQWLGPAQAQEYLVGLILLGVAPCTAMVFVWSYLSDGDPQYTLLQVSVNDLLMLVLFIPLVRLLVGVTDVNLPFGTLITSVLLFVALPLLAGYLVNRALMPKYGEKWYTDTFLARLKPFSMLALVLTVVLLFAFQGQKILQQPIVIALIAVPILIQSYSIFGLTWFLGRKMNLPYQQCAPAAMIGTSNFFELAVAVAIALFGVQSGAALATVVGVLIEVPVMLSLVAIA
ncbi:MAG: ACR3 family arsenite efflux transporter, partial [Bacteroidota bacterium]